MTQPAPEKPSPDKPTPDKPKPAKKPRRWRRRIIIALIALVCLTLLFRAILSLLLPTVLNKIAHGYKLQCTYARLDLSITGGNAAIWDLRFQPEEGGDPVFEADYCQGDISVLNLLKGRLVVYRAAADGVNIERTADGRMPLLDRFASAPAPAQPAPQNSSQTPPKPLDLQPPLRIDAFRLAHIRAKFHDASVKPEFEARSTLDVRLSDVGNPDRPARFDVEFTSDPLLDSFRITGVSERTQNGITSNLAVQMRGLHLKPAQEYLQSLGLNPIASDISASMTGKLTATPAANPQDGIQATLSLNNARIISDQTESAALDNLTLDIQSLNPGSAKLAKLTLDGVRLTAARQPDGSLRTLGLELRNTASTPKPKTPNTTLFRWSLQQFTVTNFHAAFVDQAVTPTTTLALDSPQIQLTNLVNDADHPNQLATFSATLNSPGVIREIRVNGQASPFATDRTFKLKVTGNGISPQALAPYLTAAGLSSEWKDGSFSVSADGSLSIDDTGKLTANATLANFDLLDGSNHLLSLSHAAIKGAILDPQTRTIQFDSIDVSGPALHFHRDPAGQLHTLGFKTIPSTPTTPTQPPPAAPPNSQPFPFDNFEISHFAWKDVHIDLADASVTPPADLAISDAGITIDDLSIHLRPGAYAPKEGKIHAWLVAPKIASKISLVGVITPTPDQTTCGFDIHAVGLSGDTLATDLKSSGIEPTLKDGHLKANCDLTLHQTPGQPTLSLTCTNLNYLDGPKSLISVASIQLDGLTASPHNVSLEHFEIKSPRTQIDRLKDGTVEVAGLHFLAAPPPSAAPESEMPTPQPAPAPPSNFTAGIKYLKITDAGIDFTDHSVNPNIATSLGLGCSLSNFNYAPDAQPSQFHAVANISGSLDSAKIDGTISASPTTQSAQFVVNATGLRPRVAVAYFPPNIHSAITSASFHSELSATATQNPAGGRSIDVTLRNLDYHDAGAPESFLIFGSFHVGASRVDPSASRIALDDITLTGLQASARKTPTGLDLLGLELASAPSAPKIPTASPPAAPPPPTSQPAVKNTLAQFAAERSKLPYITIKTLSMSSPRLAFTDETQPGSSPLVVSDLQIKNTNPIAWLGKDPESNPSTDIQATGKIDPVAGAFDVSAKSTPFSRQKNLSLDLTVSDIRGQGLLDLIPKLASLIDPHELQHGKFTASLAATLKLQTARPTSFDLSRGGRLDLSLKDIAFRADPVGPVLAGIGEIHSDGIVLGPDLQNIDVPELEIDNLIGRAERKSDGLHALGLIVKNPTTQPAAAAIADPPASAAIDPPPQKEFKIDRLLISGTDFRVEDQTCDPPLVVPINGLDVEAQGLSNLATSQEIPIHFNVLANAARVTLPQRRPTEQPGRDLFAQVAASGAVTLYPNIKGWSKASISGFEMLSVRGLAEQQKVKLGGGIFDGDLDVRFPGDGSVDTSTRLVLTDLSLSEPPDGFISRNLKLPAPLDVVILALQDQDGSITVPLNVDIHQGKVDGPSIAAAGAAALAQMIATAVASAPLKVTNLLGLGGNKNGPEQPVILSFPPGYSALDPAQIAALKILAKRLKDDDALQATLRSDPGRSDVSLAGQRVNPSPDDALTLAGALSRRRDALLAARLDASSQVRALLASTDTESAASAIERLRTINRQLFDTEDAMDHAYDLLRPGADRQAMRRTRAATLAIARARLDSVRQILLGSGRSAIDKSRVPSGNPQFTDAPDNSDGSVTITLIKTK